MKHKELFFIAVSTHFVFKKKHFSSSEKEVKRQSKFLQINVMNRLLSGCKDLQSLCKSPRFLASTHDLWNQPFFWLLWWLQNFRSVNKKWPNISVNLSQRLSLKCKWILSNFMKYSKMAFSLVTCWFQVYRLTFLDERIWCNLMKLS